MSSYYIRKYNIVVETYGGETVNIDQELRCTFAIEKNIMQIYQFAEIIIYNLSPNTETNLLKNAKKVTLYAGYQGGDYGVVYKGTVRQAIRGKDSAVDYYLKLVCVDGDEVLNIGICNFTQSAGSTAEAIINQIARSSSIPFKVRTQGSLPTESTSRAKVVFGKPIDSLRSLGQTSNAYVYVDDDTVSVSSISVAPPSQVPELNAKTGLIGMPMQTDQGVSFRCLINPALRLDSWVKLNNQSIIQNQIDFLSGSYTLLDIDGLYRIIEIHATGDTRGNDWYYDIIAYSQTGSLPAMLSDASQSGT